MLNAIIRFALRHRLFIIAAALFLLGYGGWEISKLPIDVLPDLNRPRVVVMTEAPGLAPEEVETLVTFPVESVLNGATGVQDVRSSSGVGLSVIYVEFGWGTDIYTARQIVSEKMQLAVDRLPEGIRPQLAPISSVMGQIMMIGMYTDRDDASAAGPRTSPMELRTLADWVVRQRIMKIPGVAQVFVMGGQRKQYQVRVDPEQLLAYDVTLHEVEDAVAGSNANVTGGYLDEQGPEEYLVRTLGRVKDVEDLQKLVVKIRDGRPVLLRQVAEVIEGPQVKRGDSSAFERTGDGDFAGGPSVVLTINKQPEADTRKVTEQITAALEDLESSLPADVRVAPDLYQQKEFIELGIDNVMEALRDGAVLVVIILFIFLLNFRTTFITLTAIPLSIVITGLIFRYFGLAINTMTLGGIAVAIGELVDDAIVDVENIYRRLRENRQAGNPKNPLLVVFQASTEIRNSIVFGTLIVVLVFLPLFALSGMEGRLFTPLGVAYIVSILASLLVSLTVTPVLSYWLLPRSRQMGHEKEGFVLRALKWLAGGVIRTTLKIPGVVLAAGVVLVVISGAFLAALESDFLPPFNEGAVQVNVILPPGTSLEKSNEVAQVVVEKLQRIDEITAIVRRSGRAEEDEHAMGVNVTEMIATLGIDKGRSREAILEDIRGVLEEVPGIVGTVEQPIAHLISHMLSGVQAQIAIKLYGDDLEKLRRLARQMEADIDTVPGVRDLQVEPQAQIPQLRIEPDRYQMAHYGLQPEDVNHFIETAMHGRVTSQVVLGVRTFDLLIRLKEEYREDREALKRLQLDLPDGGTIPLEKVAHVYTSGGPNMINREQVRRRIVVSCNVAGRGLVDVVTDIRRRLEPFEASLPTGYFVEYGGQFESQKSASQTIIVLFIVSLVGMFLVLHTLFHSANFALQVMAALPMAFIGAVAALVLTGQTLTIAAMVGFISLCGIASRNGILLLNHYIYLVRFEGETWSKEMLVRAGKERLAPVLMTALTSGIGLVPLALAAGEPGKEILYPVATVIIGGLITSTLLEFLVRPALFWSFGRGAGEKVIHARSADVPLVEKSDEEQRAEAVAASA